MCNATASMDRSDEFTAANASRRSRSDRLLHGVKQQRELLIVMALQALVLWPMLRTPYMFDDQVNSTRFRGSVDRTEHGILKYYWDLAHGWLTNGRFLFLNHMQEAVLPSESRDALVYKLLLMLLVLISTWCVATLIHRLGTPRSWAALLALFATFGFQFRIWQDPILGYYGLQQTLLAEVAISALLFHIYLRSGRRITLAASLLFLAFASFTYEYAPLLGAIHVLIAIAESRSSLRGVRRAAPAIVVSVGFILLHTLKYRFGSGNPTVHAVFNIRAIMSTLGEQLSGTLPLSYVATNPHNVFQYRSVQMLDNIGVMPVLTALAFAAAAYWFIGSSLKSAWRPPWVSPYSKVLVIGIAALLIFIPAGSIAITGKYQTLLEFGNS
jgi:hypothetical protein